MLLIDLMIRLMRYLSKADVAFGPLTVLFSLCAEVSDNQYCVLKFHITLSQNDYFLSRIAT